GGAAEFNGGGYRLGRSPHARRAEGLPAGPARPPARTGRGEHAAGPAHLRRTGLTRTPPGHGVATAGRALSASAGPDRRRTPGRGLRRAAGEPSLSHPATLSARRRKPRFDR